jgi:hypothetical protein
VNTKYNRTTSARLAVVFTALLTTIFIGRPAAADTINLAWDSNPEPQVVGYIVHVGTQSSTYTQHIDVGPATTWAFVSAVAGQQYCFAVSAYFAGPEEGPKSSEVCGFSNAPPALANPGAQSSTVGQPDTLQLAGSDPKGDPVTYTATGLPPGLTLMASTGFISGTPTTAGTYSVTGRVSDGVLTASQTFAWSVTTADTTAPVVAITGPTSAATYATTALTLTLSGSASDAVGVTQVSWVNSRGGSGTASGTTSWTASTITLQGGSNVVTVTARDAAGNTSADVLTVTANGPPTLGSVANQSSAVGFATTLQLAGSDPNGDALTYTATGLPSGMTVGASSGLIAGTPSAAGTYNATVTVSDGALSASRAFTWTIVASDTTAPVVTITGPTSAATVVVSTGALTLSGTASDSVGVTQVSWTNNRGGSGTATGTTSWSAGIALQGGSNVLTVTARDAAGNTSTDVITVTYTTADMNAPTISITAPTSAASYTTTVSQVALSGTAVDDTGVTSVTWANDRGGNGVATRPAATGAEGLVAHWRLDEGVGTVAGNATSGLEGTLANGAGWVAGRHGQAVNLDGVDDFIAVPNMDVTGTGLTIAGWVKSSSFPASLDQRFLSKSTDTAEQSHYWMLGQTNNGQNRLRFRLKAGGTTTTLIASSGNLPLNTWYHVAATYDGTMMRLYLDGVEVGAVQKSGTLAASAAVPVNIGRSPDGSNPMHGAIDDLRVYGRALSASEIGTVLQAADTTGPAWSVASVALQPGANVVSVVARDAVGNESSDVVTVTMKVAPTLASVADQSTEQGRAVTLQLTGADADGDSLTFGAMGLPPGLGVMVSSGLITGTPTTTGSYPVAVTVSDGTQTTTRSFTWTVTPETVAPTVTITSPTSTATFSTGTSAIALAGTASDNIGVTQVSWVNSRGGSGTATGTTSWSAAGIVLQGGANVLTVTTRDAAGNTSTDVLTVTYSTGDTTVPVVTITSPTTAATFASTKSTVTLHGSASDNIGVTQVTWRNDRGGSGTATGTASWSVTGVVLQDGVNVLTVTARDAAGNTSADVLTVTYTAPLRIASLTADRAAPQPLGTTVTFTAVGAGDSGPYEYHWRVYDGAKWVTASAWSTSNQFVWKPTKVTSLYQVRAVVRSATFKTAMATMPFTIVP